MWLRKHHPTCLAEMAMSEENRRTVESYARTGEMDDLLIIGPPGFGKTTLAELMEDALAFEAFADLNVAGKGGIDLIRERIVPALRVSLPVVRNRSKPFRVFRLDEAEGMTREALFALRTLMDPDNRPTWVRFILIGNNPPRDDAIIDRCQLIRMDYIPIQEKVAVLKRILLAESKEYDPDILMEWAEINYSMRSLIKEVQKQFRVHGKLDPPDHLLVELAGRNQRQDDIDLLMIAYRILKESGETRMFTKDLLAALVRTGDPRWSHWSPEEHSSSIKLGTRLGKFDVGPKAITKPGETTKQGYHLEHIEAAVAGLNAI